MLLQSNHTRTEGIENQFRKHRVRVVFNNNNNYYWLGNAMLNRMIMRRPRLRVPHAATRMRARMFTIRNKMTFKNSASRLN